MSQNNTQQTGTRFYFSIIEGDLKRKALPTDPETAVSKRTNKSGKEMDEYTATSIGGKIKDFNLFTEEYQGKKFTNLVINLSDIGENYVINIPAESRYYSSFVTKLPNIDFSQYVELSTFKFQPKDKLKPISGVTLKQGLGKVPDFYSKTNPLPNVPDFPTGGDLNEIKMWGLQQAISLKKVLEQQRERLFSVINTPEPVAENNNSEQVEDDLPF